MNFKKLFLCGAMSLAVVVAGIIAGCVVNVEPEVPPGPGPGPDLGQSQRVADSLELVRLIDSLRVIDEMRNLHIRDSIRVVDSIALTVVLDSLERTNLTAYLRMVDSLRLVNAFRAEQARIADSVRAAERAVWIADSLENERQIALAQAIADSVEVARLDSIQTAREVQRLRERDSIATAEANRLATERNATLNSFSPQARRVIGAGYDITGHYANFSEVRAHVLDFNRLAIDGFVHGDRARSYEGWISEGRDISQYQQNLSQRVNLGARVRTWWSWGRASFSAQVRANFDESEFGSTQNAFITSSGIVTIRDYKVFDPPNRLIPYLSQNFLEDLQNLSAEEIVFKYGTHVILGAKFGGRIDYNMSIRKIDHQTTASLSAYIGAKLRAGIPFIDVRVEADIESLREFRTAFDESTEKVRVISYGGSLSNASAIASNGPSGREWDNWVASVTEENMTLCDYHTNMLYLLSDFVLDPAKRAQVDGAIEARMNAMGIDVTYGVELSDMPVELDILQFAERRNLIEGDDKMISTTVDNHFRWSVVIDPVTLLEDGRDDGTYKTMRVGVTLNLEEIGTGNNTKYEFRDVFTIDLGVRNIVGIHNNFRAERQSGTYTIPRSTRRWEPIHVNRPAIMIEHLEIQAADRPQDVGYRLRVRVLVYEKVPINQRQGKRLSLDRRGGSL
jgi:hypothetical protein